MIYDHIRNTHFYEGLSESLDKSLDYISRIGISLPNGITELGNGVRAIISEYPAKKDGRKRI